MCNRDDLILNPLLNIEPMKGLEYWEDVASMEHWSDIDVVCASLKA